MISFCNAIDIEAFLEAGNKTIPNFLLSKVKLLLASFKNNFLYNVTHDPYRSGLILNNEMMIR